MLVDQVKKLPGHMFYMQNKAIGNQYIWLLISFLAICLRQLVIVIKIQCQQSLLVIHSEDIYSHLFNYPAPTCMLCGYTYYICFTLRIAANISLR